MRAGPIAAVASRSGRGPRGPAIASETISRRTVLEWLGGGTVLALSGELLAACTGPESARRQDQGPRDASGADRPRADQAAASDRSGPDVGYPFAPGEGKAPVFGPWGERTVDEQDLKQLLASWRLTVDGLVEKPRTYGFAELVALARQEQVTDFHCVEGWSIEDVPWSGLHLSRLFDAAKVKPAATHVTFHTVGGKYNESLPLPVALEPRTMLAYGIAGATIPLKHGFPLRLVIPRLLGYKNAKYVERIELADQPVNGYWVAAGYPYAGEVPPSRLRPGKY